MTALSLPWFAEEDPRDLRRWALAAAIVLAVHAGSVGAYVFVHRPDEIGQDNSPLVFELAPSDDTVDQPEVAPAPEEQPKQVEEQPPPPPEPPQAVVAPPDEPLPQPIEQPPTLAMPERVKSGAPHIDRAWETALTRHLQHYKRYPSEAQARGEEGVVFVSFTIDRAGHVFNRAIERSSGYRELDNEAMSMLERAQPWPPFPANMPQAKLDLTIPIRYSLQ